MLEIRDLRISRNAWMLFQVFLPLILIVLDLLLRDIPIVEMIRSQKMTLLGFALFMGLFSKVIAERKYLTEKDNMNILSINFLMFCIAGAFVALTAYVALLEWDKSFELSLFWIQLLYIITSIGLYLLCLVSCYSMYMFFLRKLVK